MIVLAFLSGGVWQEVWELGQDSDVGRRKQKIAIILKILKSKFNFYDQSR